MRGTYIAIGIGGLVIASALIVVAVGRLERAAPAAPDPAARPIPAAVPPNPTILFVGDMMFDRHIRRAMRTHGEDRPLQCVGQLLARADFTVGNLEGPITDRPSTSEGSVVGSPENFRFTFPTTTAPLLARYGFGAVSLGNNHILDQGSDGVRSTRRFLETAGISYFGGSAGDEPVLRETIEGVPFSFIAYNQFGGGTVEHVIATIATERAAGQVPIVFAHWGEEYIPPTASIRATARGFAEAGASLIIGAHPHVIQPSERIAGIPVYYSLGNFVFDQYFTPQVSEGLAVLAQYDGGTWSFVETRVRMDRDGSTCPVPSRS